MPISMYRIVFIKAVISLAIFILCIPPALYAQQASPNISSTSSDQLTLNNDISKGGWWTDLPKEEKMIYTTAGSVALIGLWGLATWDYGSSSGLHTADEGWFGKNTKYGGADKVGHFWSTYVFTDALSWLYRSWGYDSQKAGTYGALSAWVIQAAMELGDATSETQGFSWEDMVVNTFGALTSLLMARFPELDRKIDFRVEYTYNVGINAIFDDYSNQYYSIVLKLDGFDSFEDTFLKYFELHAGYYSRGYDTDEVSKSRGLFGGVTINLSRLFYKYDYKNISKVLEYLQLPYTVPKAYHELD